MRVAVIGAGIVGVTTAFELARDGQQVTVFERRASVAEEASFGHAGLLSMADIGAWASASLPATWLRQLIGRPGALQLARPWSGQQMAWLWRYWRARSAEQLMANHQRLHRLASYSKGRMQALAAELELGHEQSQGCLVLLRSAGDLAAARSGLKLMADLGLPFELVDAPQARQFEPGLNSQMALHAAVHLPQDGVGNCRQFAHLLRAQAQSLGARFQFQRSVRKITAGPEPVVHHAGSQPDSPVLQEEFDAVVICAALGSVDLLRPFGLRLPLAAVHGHTITAPLQQVDQQRHGGPRSAVLDDRHQITISRLGDRVRVSGGAELGGPLQQAREATIKRLYKVLDDWYPGCAQMSKLQHWNGARPSLPDGPPLVCASTAQGVWLNLGHGANGWALACGSARILADKLAGRSAEIDTEGLNLSRLLPT